MTELQRKALHTSFEFILETSKGVSIIVGVVFLLIMGLASWGKIPLLLRVADNEPHNLTFSTGLGLVFIAIAFITVGWYLYELVRHLIKVGKGEKD